MALGADVAIAVGTSAAAVAAVIGLFIGLHTNRKDRDRADEQAHDDRKAAADQAAIDREAAAEVAAGDRQAAREDAQRWHIVDLLLELGREIATQHASTGYESQQAVQRIILLLFALPAECVRHP